MKMVLNLSKSLHDEMIEHARTVLPNEACGILAGKNDRILRVYCMNNVDCSASTYFMDPREQLRVMKEIRREELELVGIFHSHVATEAYPSARDVELAFYVGVWYVIISLADVDRPVIRNFRIVEGRIEEGRINLGE